jgi:hypothetical protein
MSQIQRDGMYGTEVDGIFFTESFPSPDCPQLREIKVERSRQNSNLPEIKKMMAAQAKAAGANAIVGFKYGQRAHKWYQLHIFKWDTESWYGEGIAVTL